VTDDPGAVRRGGESLRSVAVLFLMIGCSMAAVAASWITRDARGPAAVMRWWGRAFARIAGWRVSVSGLENLPPGGAVLVSNHQSLADIPLIMSSVPGDVRFVAKKELGRVFLFGRAMVAAGNLLVDRNDRRDAVRMMREAEERLRGGERVVLFPEGTRSADGAIGDFKSGAFRIAGAAGVPLVPIFIDGGRFALPKGALRVHPATMTVRVLPPILPVPGAGPHPPAELSRLAREAIAAAQADSVPARPL
jgi:1-acyl-sn-glycerol-3-phosphate acyltransferase